MKSLITLSFFLLLGLSLQAQNERQVQYYTFYDYTNSQRDSLRAEQFDNQLKLYWRGELIFDEFSFDLAPFRISQLGALVDERIFLLSAYQGDGCPEMYQFLWFNLEGDKPTYGLSPMFGHCGSWSAWQYRWPELRIEFDAEGEPKEDFYRAPQKWLFNLETWELKAQ